MVCLNDSTLLICRRTVVNDFTAYVRLTKLTFVSRTWTLISYSAFEHRSKPVRFSPVIAAKVHGLLLSSTYSVNTLYIFDSNSLEYQIRAHIFALQYLYSTFRSQRNQDGFSASYRALKVKCGRKCLSRFDRLPIWEHRCWLQYAI